jgi:hypothetical protein
LVALGAIYLYFNYLLCFGFVISRSKNFGAKGAHKMLMKSTPAHYSFAKKLRSQIASREKPHETF